MKWVRRFKCLWFAKIPGKTSSERCNPVFRKIKQARGFRQFLLRVLKKVQGEWAMICLTHNILRLHRLCYG